MENYFLAALYCRSFWAKKKRYLNSGYTAGFAVNFDKYHRLQQSIYVCFLPAYRLAKPKMLTKKITTKLNLLIFPVILLAAFLYFYNLSNNPPGFYSDEAVVAYNAYSILKTGRDEYGQILPVLFRFFGSYTPGLFVYFLVPFIKIFGLSVLTVRGVNAVLMILTGVFLYLFLKKLLPRHNTYFLLLALLCYYLTPWSVFNARLGYEVTFAYFLFCWAAYLLAEKKLTPAFILLSFSTYAAHPYRYLSPLLILIYLLLFKPELKKTIKALIPTVIIQIPNFYMVFTPAFWIKSSYLNINFLNQYLTFFSPSNIFSQEDIDPQRSIPQIAIFYFWQFIPLIVGFVYLFKNRHHYLYRLIFLLLLLAPLPAAFANANYATQRAVALLFPYSLIISLGIIKLLDYPITKYLFLLIVPLSLLLIWRSYFIFLPKERAFQWYDGFKEITEFINNHQDMNFIIDDSYHIPHIEYLFFSKYPPEKFQQQNGVLKNYYYNTLFVNTGKFPNIVIKRIDKQSDVNRKQVLIYSVYRDFSPDQIKQYCLTKIFEYNDYQGQPLFRGYLTNPNYLNQNCYNLPSDL